MNECVASGGVDLAAEATVVVVAAEATRYRRVDMEAPARLSEETSWRALRPGVDEVVDKRSRLRMGPPPATKTTASSESNMNQSQGRRTRLLVARPFSSLSRFAASTEDIVGLTSTASTMLLLLILNIEEWCRSGNQIRTCL